jgi:RNA 3'-terminal phosphate cyclase (ATP)
MRDPIPVVLGGSGDDGPLLRTALALAACAGRGFRMTRFGEGRAEPGLGQAELAAVRAVGTLCGAELGGDDLGSRELRFEPRHAARPASGLTVEAGAGGAAGPLLLTLCWPLALAGAASTVTIRGTTHGASRPGFHELVLAWTPALARLGFQLSLSLGRAGFEGGEGELFARVEPAHAMPPLDLRHRGLLQEVRVLALTGGGAAAAAGHGLAERAVRGLRRLGVAAEAEAMALPASDAEGAQVLVLATFERARTAHAAVPGPAGGPDAAAEVVAAFGEQLHSGGATDHRLGVQLLLPAALLAARIVPPPAGLVPVTRWSVGRVTRQLLDGVALLPRLLDVSAAVFGREGEPGEVRVAPADAPPDVLPLRRDGERPEDPTAAASS